MKHLMLLASCLLVAACGGGGGGGGGASATATGTITIGITDASIYDWDEALLEVEAITLIGSGGQETELLDPPQIIDLLRLRNVSELLLHRTLTARKISKIRLVVGAIRLNKFDMMDGTITDFALPPVPTRKIDLNPEGPLEIRAGEDLTIMLDVDLENSIKITGTGTGDILFRPLVRLTIGPSGLVRLFGSLDVIADPWILSNLSRVSDADGIFDVLPIEVEIDRTNADYFDSDGNPVDPGSIDDMNKASVYGYYRDTPDGRVLDAEIIAVGSRGTFNTFVGPVQDRWDPIDRDFSLNVSVGGVLPVVLSDGSRVFDVDGEVVAEASIQSGLRTLARGKWTPDPSGLQAFVAFVGGPGDIISVEGEVDTTEGGTITLINGDCAVTKPATTYFEIATEGDTSTISRITADQIGPDDTIVANGGDTLGLCVDADTVVKETAMESRRRREFDPLRLEKTADSFRHRSPRTIAPRWYPALAPPA
jgi:hypothetical protein